MHNFHSIFQFVIVFFFNLSILSPFISQFAIFVIIIHGNTTLLTMQIKHGAVPYHNCIHHLITENKIAILIFLASNEIQKYKSFTVNSI